MRSCPPFSRLWLTGIITVMMLAGVVCNGKSDPPTETPFQPPHVLPQPLSTIPHDSLSFTQGLFYRKGTLYESTGLYGKSTIRILDTAGAILRSHALANDLFGEGCALFNDRIYQITWHRQLCIVYSPSDLAPVDTFTYAGEGWGLTGNDTLLIMSNGSDTLYFRNRSFELVRTLPVTSSGIALERLNELEYARGRIYANVWYSDFIFEINPETGVVERIFDCTELVAREAPSSDQHVLNGIAYDADNDRFFLTGKNWKHIFVVTLP